MYAHTAGGAEGQQTQEKRPEDDVVEAEYEEVEEVKEEPRK